MKITPNEISGDMIGQTVNGLRIMKVIDGSKGEGGQWFRYKFKQKNGDDVKDVEGKTIIYEHPIPWEGDGNKTRGVEFIGTRPMHPDQRDIWWVENPRFRKVKFGVSSKGDTVYNEDLVSGQWKMGTFEEFCKIANQADGEVPPETVSSAKYCKAKTKSGESCKGRATADSDFCMAHQR